MRVELVGIHKSFGPVQANQDINLTIPAGVIQGILGENGAGKSTLMKVLSGFFTADQGKILLDGQEVHIQNPADAIVHGIGMLHQDPLDFPPMKVVDNFIVGSPPRPGLGRIFPNQKQAAEEMQALQKQFNFDLDPYAYVDSLTVGERQQLEILRLLWLGARVLILDEPTTGISAPQKVKLFETLRLLAQQGKTMIFVSHKLEDVEQLCHRAAVLRQGRLVGSAEPPYATGELVQMMFGKTIAQVEKETTCTGDPVIEMHDLSLEDGRLHLHGANLRACCGEIIGLAGMEGSGQRSLLRACAGLLRPTGGQIVFKGQDLTGKNFHAFMERGVAYVPASRMEEGLIPGLNLTEHFILAGDQKGLFIDRQEAQDLTRTRIDDFNIRGRPGSTVESLSGGNQQRALLAMMKTPLNLILMEHPTRGLDVESAIWIWNKMRERCRLGASIIFISSDLEEILLYSDRILVFFAGQVSEPIDATRTSVEALGQLIGGKGFATAETEKRHA